MINLMGSRNSRIRVLTVEQSHEVQSFELVWFDERSAEILRMNDVYSEQISSLDEYHLRFFHHVNECEEYLNQLPMNTKVMFLVHHQYAEEIISKIHRLCAIKFILVIYPMEIDMNNQNQIISQYSKIKHVQLDQLAKQVQWFDGRFLRNSAEFLSIDIFQANERVQLSSTKINGRFLFSQLLLDILLRMEPKLNDRDEFIACCSELYANNPSELSKLKKFQLNYDSKDVFEWYSRELFVYHLLNKALRTENIDLLFLFRFILQDLEKGLIKYQAQSLINVQRGQVLSKDEWNELSNSVDHYISMNSFLSTTLAEGMAEIYVPDNLQESDKVPVIFEIQADPNLPGSVRPFANITHKSHYPTEKEVLFMAGCLFQITEIVQDTNPRRIRMKLCSNEENNLKTLFQSLRSEYGGEHIGYENEATMNSLGIVLYNADRYDLADRFFRRMYNETSTDDWMRARYCHNIGNVAMHHDQYEESAQWYNRALTLYEANGIINHPSVATLHLARANLSSQMSKRKQALESYNKALTMFQTIHGEYHPKIACCYFNMASQFERWRYYQTAIHYRQLAVEIGEKTLPNMHPDLIIYHFSLAILLCRLRHRDLVSALEHAQKSLTIANHVLPPNHSDFRDVYNVLGSIYESMGNLGQANHWFEKVDELGEFQSINIHLQRMCNRRKEYTCIRCHRRFWIYRSFHWMKDTRLNCLIFHRFGSFLLDIKRYCFHY